MAISIDWVPHPPPPRPYRPKQRTRKYTLQFERALKAHQAEHGCPPRRATLYLAADMESLERVEFDPAECGL
jgi:hypothetical protein